MGRIVLFERGDVGGLFIGNGGIRTIPPFPASILAHLRAVDELMRSTAGQPTTVTQDMSGLITKISNLAVERVEAAIGPLDPSDSLIYLTDDDGFVCGSTGAPPRPIGWPALGGFGPVDLVDSGLLAPDLLEVLRRAPQQGFAVVDILEDPDAAAAAVDLELSETATATLRQLAPSQLSVLQNPVDREVVGLFHKVIEDGRFLESWAMQPVAVSDTIGVKLSDAAVDKILGSSAIVGREPQVANLSIEQGIVVGIVAIIVLDQDVPVETIIDRSGREKF